MLKRSLLSLSVAAIMVSTSGCKISSVEDNNVVDTTAVTAQNPELDANGELKAPHPYFDPARSIIPLGIDFLFAKASTSNGTAHTGAAVASAVTKAIDDLDGGISTIAPIDFRFSEEIDADSIETVFNPGAGKVPNVLVLKLANANDDALIDTLDLADIAGQGTGAIKGALNQGLLLDGSPVNDELFRVSVVSLNGETGTTLRINFTKPLEPKTKYLVILTKGIKTADEEDVVASSQYNNLRGNNAQLNLSTVSGAHLLVKGWEKIAQGYFAGINDYAGTTVFPAVDVTAENLDLSVNNNVVLTSAFTTVGTTDVLLGMLAPQTAINSFVSGAVVKSVKAQVRAQLPAGTSSTDAWAAIESNVASAPVVSTISAAQTGVSTALSDASYVYSNASARNVTLFGALNGELILDSKTAPPALGLTYQGKVTQGAITLPYYLATPGQYDPDAEDQVAQITDAATKIQNTTWTADATLGAVIKGVLGTGKTEQEQAAIVIPPKDVDGATEVNRRYPFAQKTADVTVPVIVSLPDETTLAALDAVNGVRPANGWPVIVYQHGIFGSRAHSLPMANALGAGCIDSTGPSLKNSSVQGCFATVAIDLPLHGIAPLLGDGTADPFASLSVDSATMETLFNGSFPTLSERHFGYSADAENIASPMVWTNDSETEADERFGYSGSMFINVSNFQVSRDNVRQAVMDLSNLMASLSKFDLDEDGDHDPATDKLFDTSKVYFVGHSLGGIVGTTFMSVYNHVQAGYGLPAIQAAALITPGQNITRLLENSPSIGATEGGLLDKIEAGSKGKVKQGERDYEAYFNVLQATIDSIDPANYASMLKLQAKPLMVYEIVGNGSTRLSDQTIPNRTYCETDELVAGACIWTMRIAENNYLAGTEPLIKQLNLTAYTSAGLKTNGGSAVRGVVRFNAGTHTTNIKPTDANGNLVFGEYATQLATFFASNGLQVPVGTYNSNAGTAVISTTDPLNP
ncbi:MAG: hypothetical protein H7A08_09720 [Oceanospirillaceae bacterium]|nr:hypothetical protein [Oceanospirillaceae bacterium]